MNGSVINFQLLDGEFTSLTGSINQNGLDTSWTLILEFEGIQ
jgi:hypothetical protein